MRKIVDDGVPMSIIDRNSKLEMSEYLNEREWTLINRHKRGFATINPHDIEKNREGVKG